MKKIIYAILGLVVIAIIAITFMIDSVGKDYAQEFAQKLLKTPVSISQFSTSFSDKRLDIDFIEVQNPKGFKNKNAFALNHFSLKIGGNVFSDLIEVELLELDGLKFVLEQGDNGVNLTQLLDNLERQSSGSEPSSVQSKGAGNKRIKIKRFLVKNIELKIDTKLLKTSLNVPDISVHDFGGNAGGSTDEIGKQIVKAMLKNLQKTLIRKIGDKLGISDLKEKINLDTIKNKTKNLLKGLGS